jgi:Putative zinc-finger
MALNPIQKTGYTMMRLMARMMPPCKEIAALVSENMDRQLPLRQRLLIRFHVMMCSLCRRYEKQLHMLREGTHHYADPDENEVGESLSPEVRKRLEKALADNAK